MKKNILIFATAAAMVMPLASSCNKWLEEHPKAIAVDTFYNTVDDANAAIASISAKHAAVRRGSAFIAFQECFSDYNYGRGTWAANNTHELLNVTNKGRTDGIWGNLYKTIRDANIAISKLPEANALTDAQKKAYVAEAKFYRAFAYFDLARYWGNCILRTEKNMTEWDQPLTKEAEIWAFLIQDLKDAVADCPDKPVMVGRPYKDAARALLADVYMTRKDFASAKPLLQAIVDSKSYSLVSCATSRDFDNIFGASVTSSSEEIFYAKTSRTNNMGWEWIMFTAHPNAKVNGGKMCGAGGWYALVLCKDNVCVKNWDAKDLRKDFNVMDFPSMGANNVDGLDQNALNVKFYDPDAASSGGSTCDNPMYRYADVLIMLAECINEVSGPDAQSMEYLNMIHRRGYGFNPTEVSAVDLKLSDYNTKEKFMEILTQEQLYEFWAEGKRWPFLVRTGQADKYIMKGKGHSINPNLYHFPIPDTEFTYNLALDRTKDQNPGY